MGKCCQILTELSALDTPIFSFPDDILCKCQGIVTKLGTCIDIREIWLGIANGQISSMFDRLTSPRHNNNGVLYFKVFSRQKYNACPLPVFVKKTYAIQHHLNLC